MKKIFLFILLIVVAIPGWSDEWFINGNSTPIQWTDNAEKHQVTAFIPQDNGTYVWIGKLVTAGDGDGFKVGRNASSFSGWGDCHPSKADLVINEVGTDGIVSGGNDTKWKISKDGIYKLTITEGNPCTLKCEEFRPSIKKDNEGYYLLGSAEDLFEFAELVSHSAIESNSKAKLTANIDYSEYTRSTIGRHKDYAFKGTFDGQGHSIKINIKTEDETTSRTGLFACINAATIKNLVVEGDVTSKHKNCVGGLGGRSDSDGTLIENVIVKTNVRYEGSSTDATCGGFFANMEAKATLRNCAFLGSIDTGTAEGNGGLVGWAGSGASMNIINCYVAPTQYTKNGNSQDFARNNPTETNSHYIDAANRAKLASGELCYMLNGKISGGKNWYQNLSGDVDTIPVPFSSHGTVYLNGSYCCDGVTPKPGADVKYANVEERYVDEHTFGENDLCSGCMAAGLEPEKKDGVYQIGNCGEFVWFASHVNGGNGSAAAVLTDDINMKKVVYTPIGNTTTKYSGTFDGQYYSIRNLVIDDKEKSNVGVFGVITGGAVIKNLAVDSTCVFTANAKVGAIAGLAAGGGTFTFSNLLNAANVKAEGSVDANAAGLVGCCIDGTTATVTNCINAGAISAYSDNQNQAGAFTGWSQAGSTYTNCLNIGEIANDGGLLRGTATQTNCHNVAATDSTVASGELCYKMNGDQSDVNWFQNLGTDPYPVPFSSHAKVYANGQLKCDGTSAGGELTYSNSNTSEIPPHTYKDCWCSVCGAYQEDGITATDGWYLISNAAQLRWMAESVTEHNEKYGKANIKLTADIDYRKYTDQAAMFGKPSNTYKGTFDGQNHTVTVAFVNNVSDETGLFRRINGGTVKNLKVAGTITTNKSFAAGICSGIWQTGTITNCESAVKISDENGSGDATHGGILARVSDKNDVNVTNCLFSGELNAPNRIGCGGIIGWPDNGGTNVHVKNNLVTGTINLKDDENNDVIVRNTADADNNYYSCELSNNLRNSKKATLASKEIVASGELCYKLNAGGENWFQNLGADGDSHPVPFSSHLALYKTSDAGWSTLYDAENALRFNGAKAYTGKVVGQWLILNEVEEIPAATAVLLEGTYYNKVVLDGAAEVEGNDLVGAAEDVEADGTQYVFAQKNNKLGFYKAEAGTTIKAGKGYISAASSSVKGFIIDLDGTTAIQGVEAEATIPTMVYDLSGRRVKKVQKGIYIVNGKKIAVK